MDFINDDAPKSLNSLISFFFLILLLPLFVYGVFQLTTLFSKAAGTTASIIVDAQTIISGPINNNFYHAFAQGGEEQSDMIAPIIPEVKALSPKLIRVDHIYDYYHVVSKSGDNLQFNFNELDKIVDSILKTGAKPVLSLSYMPPAIASKGIIKPPDKWSDWSLVVEKTVAHYSGKNDKNINDVYYEVWNEPDLANFGNWNITDYLTLYKYSVNGATSTTNVNRFFIGGPATTGFKPDWIAAMADSGIRIDFLSWHTYLSDPSRYVTDQFNVNDTLITHPRLMAMPKLITEFGFTGNKNAGYGTQYAAAFTGAVIRRLILGGPQYLFSFELKDGPNQNDNQGWGLLSHENAGKTKKPRYFVYNFLDQMHGQLLKLSGEGSWVTGYAVKSPQKIQIALINFDFNGIGHVETVPVTITGLPDGNYTSKVKYLFNTKLNNAIEPQKIPVTNSNTVNLINQIYLPSQDIAIYEITQL